MSKVLYITANPKTEDQSYSLSVGRAFLNAYKQEKPNDEIIEIDLYKTDIPYIDMDVFSGWGKLAGGTEFEKLNTEEKEKVGKINQFTDQFTSADKYVFVTPMWNLSVPPKMKAYIDTVAIAGKTFKYTESGPVGLLGDKKAVHVQARGGVYSQGPAKDFEFGDSYIRTQLSFFGIPSIESVIVEGMNQTPNEAEQIKTKAMENAKEVAKRFAQ